MDTILKLRNYYNNNCKGLVFVGEKVLKDNNKCKMYFLSVDNKIELNNYRKVFQEYLVFYVRNRDHLSSMKSIIEASTDELLSQKLLFEGKKIHENKGLYPQIEISQSGIYGELFNDFYLNIVKQEEVISTYSMRSSFGVPNVKGIDIVSVKLEEDNICLIFSESKFVSSIVSAATNLCNDISGKDGQLGHLTKDYINSYTSFFMNKYHSIYFNKEKSKLIMLKLNNLNDLIMNENKQPINAINDLNIRIRFDFFAIYYDTIYNIEDRKKYFEQIVNQFNANILSTGIKNYDIEVIFIPTKNESIVIKRGIEEWV